MPKSCASLDHTSWSYLPARAPSSWPHGAAWFFSPTAATFENDALASALVRASMPPSSPTPTPSSSTTTSSASELSSFVPHDAPLPPLSCTPVAASGARPQARCRTGRVTKRKPRPSRRAPVTYITADPADFRRMVQEITGFQAPGAERAESPAPPRAQAALAFVLPTLDTSASFLLDRAPVPPQPEEDSTSGCRAATTSSADDWSRVLTQELELEAMVCAPAVASAFPMLDSWGWGMI